jgi:Encapsulating protein for peroxidase
MGTFWDRRSTLRSCCTTNGPPAGNEKYGSTLAASAAGAPTVIGSLPRTGTADSRQRASENQRFRCGCRIVADLRPIYVWCEHLNRPVDGDIIWAPAIDGAFVLSTRGGDFDLQLGTDVAIGYLPHDADTRAALPAGDPEVPGLHRRGVGGAHAIAQRPRNCSRSAIAGSISPVATS